jgi:AraC-like DNA-binding protein
MTYEPMNLTLLICIVLFIGAAQGFLLSISLVTIKRGNKKANLILAFLLFIFSFMIFFHSLSEIQRGKIDNEHAHTGQTILLLVAPLIYLYVNALIKQTFKFSVKDLIHLLPFVLVLIFYISYPAEKNFNNFLPLPEKIFLWVMVIQMTIYFFFSVYYLNEHNRRIKNTFSTIDKINLRWLRFLIVANTIIWPLAFLIELLKKHSGDFDLIWILISILIYLIGYKGLKQPEIFSGEIKNNREAEISRKKYVKSGLTDENADEVFNRLNEFMLSSKSFLDSNLNLPGLAKQLNISTHHLSQIINKKAEQNFFEYINKFRIEEAKRLLKNPEMNHLTISAIGFEVGFNSTSTFNSVFKNLTGTTPSKYQKS